MAFTEEQEEILKRIIEAFQNGKTIADLQKFTTNGKSAYDLPIETIMPVSGDSGCIRAGVLHDALNATVNSKLATLEEKTKLANAPIISLDAHALAGWNGYTCDVDGTGNAEYKQIQSSCLRVKNAAYYENKGYRIALFRKITQINNNNEFDPEIDINEDAHYFNYKKKKHKGWRRWTSKGTFDSFNFDLLRIDGNGTLVYNDKTITAEFLISYKTITRKTITGDVEEYLRVLWGSRSKERPLSLNAKHASIKLSLALAYCDKNWNIVSNIVPFHVLVYYGFALNQDHEMAKTAKWNFCFTY